MKFVPFEPIEEEREIILKEDQEKKNRFVPFSPEEQERVKTNTLEQAWKGTAGVNPDEEAEVRSLAERNGWPLWMVQRKPENKQLAKANVEMPDWAKLSETHPRTSNFLGLPGSMALSRDDVESLKKIEDLPKTGIPAMAGNFIEGTKSGMLQLESSQIGWRQLTGHATEEDLARLAEIEKLNTSDNKTAFFSAGQLLPQIVKQALMGLGYGTSMGLTGAGMATIAGQAGPQALLPEEVITVPLAGMMGLRQGWKYGYGKSAFILEGGSAYQEYRNMKDSDGNPMDENAAKVAAILAGFGNMLIEEAQADVLLRTIPGWNAIKKQLTRQGMSKLLRNPTTMKALGSLGAKFAGNLSFETATEMIQEGVTILGGMLGGVMSGQDIGQPIGQEVAQRIAETGIQAAKGFGLIMLPGASVNAHYDLQAVRKSQEHQQAYVNLAEALSESKLQARSPEAMAGFMSKAFKDSGYETTHVDAEALTNYFQEQGIPLEEGAKAVGTTAEAVTEALGTTGKVEVSTADWATKTAGTPVGEAMAGDITFDPNVPTAKERVVEEKEMQERNRRDIEKAEQMLAEDDALQSDLTYAKDSFLTMATAAGVKQEEAIAASSLIEANLKAGMARYGVNPRGAFDSMGLSIRAEDGSMVLPDGTSYGQDGKIQFNDAFKAWFGDSKVVDDKGEPLVVYHGTNEDFDEFKKTKGLRSYGISVREEPSRGFFFSSSHEDSENYGENVRPFYLSSQKMFNASVSQEDALYILEPLLYRDDRGRLSVDSGISRFDVKEGSSEWVSLLFSDGKLEWDALDNDDVVARMKERGYDGVLVFEEEDESETSYFVFSPTQIKSVHNEGTWSGETGNIYKQEIALSPVTMPVSEPGSAPWGKTQEEFIAEGGTAEEHKAAVQKAVLADNVVQDDVVAPYRVLAEMNNIKKKNIERTAQRAELIEKHGETSFQYDQGEGRFIVVSPSLHNKGQWQATFFDEKGPMSDMQRDSYDSLVKELQQQEGVDLSKGLRLPDVKTYAQSVWHGSPYRFSKFTLDHMGRGEGAQAFGWGLYFAGKREISEGYRKDLSSETFIYTAGDGRTFSNPDSEAFHVAELAYLYGGEKFAEEGLALLRRNYRGKSNEALYHELQKAGVEQERTPDGQLYEVEIPEDDVMLHWDRPLSEQPEAVREALSEAVESRRAQMKTREHIYTRPVDDILARQKGEDWYEDIAGLQGSPQAASEYLNSLGIKGIKYLDGNSRSKGEGTYNYVVFDDECIEILKTYYQAQDNFRVQGQTSFSDGQAIISLFQTADRSTLVHEMGHVFLENLRNLAVDSDKARVDLDEFNAWLGVDEWESLTDEQRIDAHEKFARTFEAYLMNGHAPTVGLRRVFASFRDWLVGIYKNIMGLKESSGRDIELTDEAKDLFNRLLATDEEIEEVKVLAGYDSAVESTPQSLETHKAADDEAKADVGKSDAKALSKRRKHLTGQIRQELSEHRGYKALADMKKSKDKGGIKVNDDEIVEAYGDNFLIGSIVPLGISSKTSTWTLDDIATIYGYGSGDEMIQEITQMPPMTKAVKARVDAQMLAEARPSKDETAGAMNNETRLQALSEERQALLGGVDDLDDKDAPEWVALQEQIEADKENPVSRTNVVKKIKELGGIKYDSIVSEWGQAEASALQKRTGGSFLRKKGLGFDIMAQELRDAGLPVGSDQALYDLLMSREEKTAEVDVAVDSESLPWLVWMLGHEGAGKYLRKRKRSVSKEQKANREKFDTEREAGQDVESLRQLITEAQVELDYIKRALKVLDAKKQKVEKADDDFTVDFNPETFETAKGKVEWQQTTVEEAIEQKATSPTTMKDAWTLASRISRIAHKEGIKEGKKRSSEARKKIRDKVKEANAERTKWKKNVSTTIKARVDAAKGIAQKAIGAKKVSTLKPAIYIAAGKKAQRAVERALKDNNFEEATRQKDLQIINTALAMEATRAKRLTSKIERYLKKMSKMRKPGTLDPTYFEKIHSLLDGVAFGSRRRKQEAEIAQFLEWKKQQEDTGEIVIVPDRLLAKMGRVHWQDLTFTDLMDLGDAVKNLEHLGRMKHRLITDREKRTFDEAVESLVDSVHENVGVKHPQNLNPNQHIADKAMSGLRGLAAMHKRMEFLFRQLDGEKDMGVAWNLFFKPFVDAQNAETVMKEEAAHIMAELFSLIDVKHMMKEKYYPGVGLNLSKENILSMALNWGAEGNRQRLLSGHNLTEDQVMEVFSELSETDWAFVQAMWDYLGSYRPEVAKLERDMAGVEPAWVEASPFVTPSGITMRGGYYHIKYDPTKNIKAFEFDEKKKVEDFMSIQAYRAQTRHGFTKARASEVQGRPLDLHLSVASEHVNEVIHDLTHRRAVRDVAKLLDDKRVQQAINEAVGQEMWRELKPWLQNIASVGNHEPINGWEKILSHARKGVTVGVLGLKMTTSMMQVMSIFGASERIGQAGMLKSIFSFYHNPAKWKEKAQFVFDRSPEIRNRRNTWDRDVKYVVESQIGRGKKGRITAAMFYTHGLMDAAAVIPVWLEAYDQKLSETGNEQKAVYYADSVIRQTQPASNPKDLPSIMRGHPSRKLFTMFYSYFSVLNNLFASRFGMTKGIKDLPRLAASFVWLVFVPAVLGQIATGRGPDDDDDWASWLLMQNLLYPTQTLVGIRDVASALAHPEFGYKLSPAVNAFESIVRLGVQAKQAIVDDDDWDDILTPALEVAGYWGQFPVLQTKITVGQLFLYLSGEESDWDISQLFVKKRR